MRAGIIGLSSSGKTTLMGAFMGSNFTSSGKGKDIGVVSVPDRRLYELEKIYSPHKTTPSTVLIEELPPLDTKIKEDKVKFFDKSKTIDLQILCVGGYRYSEPEDIINELARIRFELILMDLEIISGRIENIEKEMKRFPKFKEQKKTELEILNKFAKCLEEERLLSSIETYDREKDVLRNYNFFTMRPSIYVINLSQEQFIDERNFFEEKIREYLGNERDSSPFILIDSLTEADILDMNDREREEFLRLFSLEEPSKNKIVRKVYHLLGLITFFTVGKDEVRAWNIHRGDNAVNAAAAIHTDLARGFIRAEVVESDTLLKVGSLNAAKANGKLRLEGKKYIVKDGDIVHILFNV